MKTTSYLIIWLTLFLLLILTILLGLLLLLLSDFYSLPLNRRRQLTPPTTTTTVADITTTTTTGNNSSTHSPSLLNTHALTDDPLNDIEKQLPENQEKRQLQSPENQESGGFSMVYISNPIYGDGNGTPFETPDSSPSRLGTEDSSGDDEGDDITPELTPMKKLPVVACSVCLKDVRLMGMSESDVNSNNGVSSSCSLTPCTSSPSL